MSDTMNDHLISVVIPVFNSAKTIAEVLESVRNQTQVKSIGEILLINDGSTDSSEDMIREYKKCHPELPISYYRKENGGASSARNMGMRLARFSYIAFLDSDDLWLPQKIEIQMNILDNHPDIWFLGAGYEDKPFYILTKKIEGLYKASIKDICIKNFPVTPSVIFKREALDIVGFFDESQKFGEDINYYQRFCSKLNYYYLPQKLVTIGFQKKFFGESGLTANMKQMHLGCVKNLREVYQEGLISSWFYIAMRAFYTLKYIRRIIVRKLR